MPGQENKEQSWKGPAAPEEESLQGWEPEVGVDTSLERVVDLAFDYRGEITIEKADGTQLVGYLFNRDSTVSNPYVQLFDRKGDGPFNIPYADIRRVRFTGRDTAADKSHEAWKRRREAEKG